MAHFTLGLTYVMTGNIDAAHDELKQLGDMDEDLQQQLAAMIEEREKEL